MAGAGVAFPLVHAPAEAVPLPDASFDVIFCDHGGMSFADPERTVPEAARLLRPGGLFMFNMATPIFHLCFNDNADTVEDRLHHDYFTLGRMQSGDAVEYQLPYGAWIRLFRRHGFMVEDLIELQPPADAVTAYSSFAPLAWARRWPLEHIWKLRKADANP